ncbi:hypothetical protein V6N13_130596 [Hibiscus sabdariffa]|uniref:Uncharacterized protein n=2 Tax=Hibiscus sabdariffa TaxID=183260 RepID=A0ABR2BPX0_9ROSI
MLPTGKNLNLTTTMLPYGNPSGQPPEEKNPTVIVPTLEHQTSPTPLEVQSLVKKDKSDSTGVTYGITDAMDADGVTQFGVGIHGEVRPILEKSWQMGNNG